VHCCYTVVKPSFIVLLHLYHTIVTLLVDRIVVREQVVEWEVLLKQSHFLIINCVYSQTITIAAFLIGGRIFYAPISSSCFSIYNIELHAVC
jgi:hypothetical protein